MELRDAYETLKDPNERTWYDNHREDLLNGLDKDNMTKEQQQEAAFGFDINPYYKETCYKGFDDSAQGFYSVYRSVFEKIKSEEEKAWRIRDKLK